MTASGGDKRAADSLEDEPLICGVDVSGGGAAWNVMAFRRGGDARSIPRIRIRGEHTRDRSVLVGKLAEILRNQRPTRKIATMFIDMAFGTPIYDATWQRSPRLLGMINAGCMVSDGSLGRGGLAGERADSGLPWHPIMCS
jgi:hypothetical protein